MSADSPAALLINGAGTEIATNANPVRVDPTGTTAQPITDNGGSLTVDGTVAVSGSVAVTGPLTDAQLRATAVPISMAPGGYGGQVEGRAADGAAPVGNPVLIGGSDGSLTQTLLTDNLGRLVVAPAGTAGSTKGFANGRSLLAATAVVAVRETVYTEPASGAQRSMSSANAADTAAGTGARTVRITFYKLSAGVVTGPFTETVTLNGTTKVNTVATDIAYIEKMDVITVGSGLVNAGIITLFGATAGGGGTVWTIALGSNQTFSAHHYVPSDKTCFITGLLVGIKGADTTSGFLRARNQTIANTAEIQISDQVRAPSSGQSFRSYATPIQVAGPARITGFAAPDSTSSRTYYLSFDFYEE